MNDELRLIRANVDDHTVTAALAAALAAGGPTGVLGEWAPPGYTIELKVGTRGDTAVARVLTNSFD